MNVDKGYRLSTIGSKGCGGPASRLLALLAPAVAILGCAQPAAKSPGVSLAERMATAREATVEKLKPRPAAAESPARGPATGKESAVACVATADELMAAGHHREALLLYERARKLDGRQQGLSRKLAVLYDRQGDQVRALKEFEQALAETPDDADLLNDFGYYYYRGRDWTAAEKFFRRAVAKKDDHAQAWTNLGLALGQQGRYQESYEAFARAVGPAAAHSNVGVLLAGHGRRSEALAAFRQALAANPQIPQARAFVAYLEGSAAQLSTDALPRGYNEPAVSPR